MECSNLYYLLARYKDSSTIAYVSVVNADTPFYSIGKTVFNTSDDSMAHVGYMYGDVYDSTQVSYNGARSYSDEVIISNTSISADFWYADDITYNTDGNHRYYLINPYQVESSSDFQDLVGKYTFRSNSAEYNNDSVYYIAAVSGSTMYYLHLKSGDTLENVDVSYQISEDVIDNDDGTYTMIDPITIKTSDWPFIFFFFFLFWFSIFTC